ncbi:TPA: Coenzyme F420 hydrogenase/dehydrogenase, beta subunit C-terminal domain [Escherichia coli]|uniref:Coenzyme F420 hydrogenase/dehydrogenase, beta subunit C-terminal domain n=1 Tax=Escherichia coli TaxID=562 RepID=UPI000BDE81B0|nr:Coenzyme F420 hydrogenase/dehydrogenase, beta subunit C-terminal domain [Escherichia coli]EGD9748570.1 coenzyme F420 hydrogenase [Escherichia coli]EHW3189728.1 Coenzyme F420 hydrogenase/dehydrogenase, beta subunit C-terminal domain [Escherichia coli]HEL5854715.1 Coenzyme F420 hydrogenase/dehydrogenase, beta subunit C-terminal domain [Escherichia coli]
MKKIAQVIESGMCVGCGFCTENPNDMDINKEGYYRPISFIDDSLSQLVCPGKSISHNNSMAPYNLLWGPVVSCESGNAVDPDIRHKGSSGGVLTAIAVYLVDSGLVDAIIQVGVSVDNPIRNETYIMKSQEDILKCAGSRYSPSSPLSVIRSLLGNGTRYAVIGKPCDIAAMRTLVNSRQEFQEQFPYLLSFMCAGVPSEEGTRNILERWHIKHEHLISFRYRGDGWPGLTKAITDDGEEFTMTYNESWGGVLNRYLQPRCKLCADGIGEAADIVCADAWYSTTNGYPSFIEKEGRSLTIARTLKGRQLLDLALNKNVISLTPFNISDLEKIQPYQANRKQTANVRRWAVMLLGGSVPNFKGYSLNKLMFRAPIKITLKAFFGTLIRKMKGRI